MEVTGGSAEGRAQATLPEGEMKAAWRAACIAYRAVRREGKPDHPAWMAARAVVMRGVADLSENDAGCEASRAIHYCSVWHPAWLWSGVGGEWPPPGSGYSWGGNR